VIGVLRIKVRKSADSVDAIILHGDALGLHADVELTVSERSLPVLLEQVRVGGAVHGATSGGRVAIPDLSRHFIVLVPMDVAGNLEGFKPVFPGRLSFVN
jgi:hypothetical protein